MLDAIDAALARDKRWIIPLFAFAFILKLVFVLQSSDALQIKVPILDAKYYDDMARDIAAGHFIRTEAFFMGPLYPYVLALVYGAFGRSLLIAGIIQIAGGALTVVATYLAGSKVFRPSVAMTGAVLLALYGASTFYEGQLFNAWLGSLLNMLLLFVLLRESGARDTLRFVLAGLLLGLSALARANVLILLPVVVVWILFVRKGSGRFARAAAFVVSAFVVISPATIHNYAVSRDFVLITSNGGVNFYIGNNADATGVFYPPKGVDFDSDATTRRYVERMLGRDMKPSEISGYWLRQSLSFIKEHPGRELSLLLRKTALFFNGYELPQIESYDLSKRNYGIFKALFVNFWMLSSLGLVGMAFTLPRWKHYFMLHWFVLAYAFSIILFFITDRYRIQMVPVLGLFAAFALLEVIPGAFKRAGRSLLPLVLLGALILLTHPSLFALDENHLLWREHIHQARRWHAIGETDQALDEIGKAIQLRPRDPESYIHRAIIYRDSGRLFQAVEDFTRSLDLDPAMPIIHYDLAQVLRRASMYPAAVQEYLKAIDQDSLMIEAYNNLGITYRLMKEYDTAIRYFKHVIRMDPRYIKAYNNIGASLAERGDVDAAIPYFREAIERDPAYPNSYKNLAMAYIEKRRLPEARANLERYVALAPDDADAAEVLRKVMVALEADTARGGGSKE